MLINSNNNAVNKIIVLIIIILIIIKLRNVCWMIFSRIRWNIEDNNRVTFA